MKVKFKQTKEGFIYFEKENQKATRVNLLFLEDIISLISPNISLHFANTVSENSQYEVTCGIHSFKSEKNDLEHWDRGFKNLNNFGHYLTIYLTEIKKWYEAIPEQEEEIDFSFLKI